MFHRHLFHRHHPVSVVAVAICFMLAACGSGSTNAEAVSGDGPISAGDISAGDDGDVTLDLGSGDVDQSDQPAFDPCDVIDPAAFAALVPEMTPFTFNEVLTYGAGSCAYNGPRDTTWVVYVRSAEGSSPSDFITEKLGTFEESEIRPADGGAAVHEIDGDNIQAIGIESSGLIALLVAPSTGNVMTDEGWASANGYLAAQLDDLS